MPPWRDLCASGAFEFILKFDLEDLLGSKVDLISEDYLRPRIIIRILKESIRILRKKILLGLF